MTRTKLARTIRYTQARLREPSTYAGISALLAVLGFNIDPGLMKNLSMIGMTAAGAAAVAMPDNP